MDTSAINLEQKLSLFTEQWSPKIIAQMNDYVFKLAKIQGSYAYDPTGNCVEFIQGLQRIRQR